LKNSFFMQLMAHTSNLHQARDANCTWLQFLKHPHVNRKFLHPKMSALVLVRSPFRWCQCIGCVYAIAKCMLYGFIINFLLDVGGEREKVGLAGAPPHHQHIVDTHAVKCANCAFVVELCWWVGQQTDQGRRRWRRRQGFVECKIAFCKFCQRNYMFVERRAVIDAQPPCLLCDMLFIGIAIMAQTVSVDSI
jgi:hypothetical protein